MTHTDIKTEGWISFLPVRARPFAVLMRLDRPVGWWLLLLPGWWGIVTGARGIEQMTGSHWYLMILFFLGAIMMRGAGCIVNDIWDRDLDRQVERTKGRPLANGDVSVIQALALLALLLAGGGVILIQTSVLAIWFGVFSVGLVAIYPFMKRITWWPQAFLGLTFNFSALIGGSAVTSRLDPEVVALYIAGLFWTLGYDTIYAHQDKEDDTLIGVKSTARLFKDQSKKWVGLFYGLTVLLLLCVLFFSQAGLISYVFLLCVSGHLWWQLQMWDIDDPASSLKIFKSNRNYGLMVLVVLMTAYLLPTI